MNNQENDISMFLNQWEIYQYVVDADFMAHQPIKAHLREYLPQRFTDAFSVLDLGCGDASMMTDVLRHQAVSQYMGIDLSSSALIGAVNHAAQRAVSAHFEVGDLKNFPQVIQTQTFDVIVAGFSLHHLSFAEKQTFFNDCYTALNENGLLVIYDVIRQHTESRDQYLDRYCQNIVEQWHGLTPEMIAVIEHHIRSSDYPQSLQELQNLALTAGFDRMQVGYSDESAFHQLLYIDV